ncbi:MAG: carboxylate--amine ligase, partial [Pseudomonadota bacterium]
GDDQLAGYHTYIDNDGERRFEFTKKLHRRFPENFGIGVNHVTERMPDVIAVGRQFFEGVNYRGIGNLEFKYDARHDAWKIIECNPRFTAIQELILRSGLDTGSLVYAEATGGTVTLPDRFREQLQLIHIKKDFQAYRALSRQGRLSFGQWIASVPIAHVRPYFSWSDPKPGTHRFMKNMGKFFQRRVSK